MIDTPTSRRSFLKAGAAASGGLLMAVTLPGTLGQAMAAGTCLLYTSDAADE